MLFIGLMSEFEAAIDFGFGIESNLLEKDGEASSDLKITKIVLIYFNNLFGLAIVGYKSLIIYTSIKITSPTFFCWPSWD